MSAMKRVRETKASTRDFSRADGKRRGERARIRSLPHETPSIWRQRSRRSRGVRRSLGRCTLPTRSRRYAQRRLAAATTSAVKCERRRPSVATGGTVGFDDELEPAPERKRERPRRQRIEPSNAGSTTVMSPLLAWVTCPGSDDEHISIEPGERE